MQPKAPLPNELAKQLGNLFFAIAKADRALALEEYDELSQTLETEWSIYGQDKVEHIKNQFKNAQRNNRDASLCFDDFVNYLNKHPEVFSNELKTLIFNTGNNIAYALAKINKSELNILASLSIAFKNAGI